MRVYDNTAYLALQEVKRQVQLLEDTLETSEEMTRSAALIRTLITKTAALSTIFSLVTAISVTETLTLAEVGATGQIVTTFTPTDPSNDELSFSSSVPARVTVDNDGVVTVPEDADAGDAVITVTSADGAFTDTCTVTVTIA